MTEPQGNESLTHPASLTFEEAFTRLGAMVETLETGNLPLDQAAQMFEQGMALVRRCTQLLDETELRIAEIRENGGATAGAQQDSLAWGDLEMPPPDDEWEPEEELPDGN